MLPRHGSRSTKTSFRRKHEGLSLVRSWQKCLKFQVLPQWNMTRIQTVYLQWFYAKVEMMVPLHLSMSPRMRVAQMSIGKPPPLRRQSTAQWDSFSLAMIRISRVQLSEKSRTVPQIRPKTPTVMFVSNHDGVRLSMRALITAAIIAHILQAIPRIPPHQISHQSWRNPVLRRPTTISLWQ